MKAIIPMEFTAFFVVTEIKPAHNEAAAAVMGKLSLAFQVSCDPMQPLQCSIMGRLKSSCLVGDSLLLLVRLMDSILLPRD